MLNVTQPNLGIIFISYSEVRNPKDFQSVTTDCCNGQLPKELLVDDLSVDNHKDYQILSIPIEPQPFQLFIITLKNLEKCLLSAL